MFQLPEFYTEHLNLQGAYYDPEKEDLVITAETRIPMAPAIGVPAAELIDVLSDADDDREVDTGETVEGAKKLFALGKALVGKKK